VVTAPIRPDWRLDWMRAERPFVSNGYQGVGEPGEICVVGATRWPQIVVVAGHSVNHTREGALKGADRATGGLALLLAQNSGVSALAMAGHDPGDANWDAEHRLKSALAALDPAPQLLIDLHGMADHDNVDLDLGRGVERDDPGSFVHILHDEARRRDLITEMDWRFTADRPTTLTTWAQCRGWDAVQVEIASRNRPPDASPQRAVSVVEALLESLERFLHRTDVRT
jgi:hypothetical protein